MKPRLLLLPLLLLLFLPADLLAQGCSVCKAAVETNDNGLSGAQAIGHGLNSGILYLMAVPYLLIFFAFRKKIFSFFRELSHAQG